MNIRLAPIGDFVDPVRTWNPATTPDSTFNYVDLSAVDQIDKQIRYSVPVRGSEAPSRARQLICKGDILVSTVRPNLNGVATVTDAFDGATASTGFCVLRPRNEKLSSNYLMHWVRTQQFIDRMVREATGASYPAVSDRIIKASPIPLPPLEEQRRIAAILDKADAQRRKRKCALDLLGSLTQAIFLEMFGEPGLSKRFPQVPLNEIAAKITDGEHQNPEFASAGMPMVMASQVLDDGIDIGEAKFVSVADGERFRRKCGPQKGDILIVGRGATIGRTSIVDVSTSFCLMGSVILIKPEAKLVDSRYLTVLFKFPRIRAALYNTSGSSAQQAIYLSHLKKMKILLPPIEDQMEFAERAERIAAAKRLYFSDSKMIEMLFSSLQHRAFSGQL
ncbi:restriction endonuclease subunit S [Bradyrhizobium sp.]|uniref:restriction endonuclease subunit S n=1 Tax=Bradyrhizobium sp. TaxID=376 RepID=UPI003C74C980